MNVYIWMQWRGDSGGAPIGAYRTREQAEHLVRIAGDPKDHVAELNLDAIPQSANADVLQELERLQSLADLMKVRGA